MARAGRRRCRQIVEVFCDESLDRGGYDLIGGLWISRPRAQRIRAIIQKIRQRFNHPHEFKWTKATGAELSPAYRELASKITQQIWAQRIAFNCIVVPRDRVNYQKYHDGDHELGYYKFVHLLVRKRIEPGQAYLVRLDRRTTRKNTRLSDLRRVLNNCGRKDHGLGYHCCLDVQAIPSKQDDLLQATDVLLGAVGWHYAGLHRNPRSSMAKNDLADRIASGIRKADLAFVSHRHEPRFNIWLWNPGSN